MLRIRGKLLLAYLLPATAILVTFAWLAYGAMRRTLEEELSQRLISLAQAASAQLDPALIDGLRRAMQQDTDEEIRRSRTYGYLQRRLERLRVATGVRSISLFDHQRRNLVDASGKTPVGEQIYAREADAAELAQVFAGRSRASILFTGADGAIYKSGYAPIRRGGRVIAALAVDGPARFFTVLSRIRNTLLAAGGTLVAAVALISLLVASRITRPLRELVGAAQAIGGGDLASPIEVRTQDEVGFLARTMDQMRERIQTRDQQMQMMLSGIAHEVRNPLGGIELYAGLLREDLRDEPRRLARIQKIERELAYLKSVVNDFLDYTRKVPLERSTVQLDPYLRDLVALIESDAQDRGVALTLEVTPPDLTIQADADKLRRAVLNLLRNGLQAIAGDGSLAVSARPAADGAVLLAVRDTGEGIPPEARAEIFTPFFTTRERGTGLGLAFVNKLVLEHGGDVDVETEVGVGTTITLRLPRGESE